MDLVVVGTGGLAREFLNFFSNQVNIVGFSSTNKSEYQKFNLPGKFFESEITPQTVGTKYCVVAIGSPAIKKSVSEKLTTKGFIFPNIIHSSSIVAGKIKSSIAGIIISPNCIVGPDVSFGGHVYLNFMVGVGHDAILGNYIQVNPGVIIGGAAVIEDEVLIGSGSKLRQRIKIRKNATVGSGSVVLSSVREGITVIGNPAKRLKLPKFD